MKKTIKNIYCILLAVILGISAVLPAAAEAEPAPKGTSAGELRIESQPADATVPEGGTATFTVTAAGGAGGYRYQWKYSTNGTSWTSVSSAAGKTPTYTTTATLARNGRRYRCYVTDAAGTQVKSSAATLTVTAAVSELRIESQPADVTVTKGGTATFTVTAAGGAGGYTYQWKYSTNGTSWTSVSSAAGKTPTYTTTATLARNGRRYRCYVTDAAGTQVTSSAAVLTVTAAVSGLCIESDPADLTVTEGETATFTVTAAGGAGGYTYRWEYSNNGTSWTRITAASGKTRTFTTSTTLAKNGRRYRCIVTDAAGTSVTSGAAVLTVLRDELRIESNPEDVTVTEGGTATFTVTAAGGTGGYTYQWKYSTNGTSWTSVSSAAGKTPTYTTTATLARNGRQYRCYVTDAAGATAVSNPATMTVEAAPAVYRALVIGNHAYTGTNGALDAPDDDARGIEKMLKEVNGPYSVTVAYNKTGSEIKNLIRTTFSGAGENDVCVFYYSGHGSQSAGLVGIDNRSYVSPSDLATALNAVCPNGALIMLDCCYSGGFISTNSTTASATASRTLPLNLQRFNESFVNAFRRVDGKRTVLPGAAGIMSTPLTTGKYTILTACTYSQESTELRYSDHTGYGLFTKCLLEGLGNSWNTSSHSYNSYGGSMPADTNGNSAVTLGELYTYIQTAVETFISNWNANHTPLITQDVQCYGTASAVLFER